MMQLLAFLLFPALELYLLFKAGAVIGAFNLLLCLFASALLGIWVMRARGRIIMTRVSAELSQGRAPQEAMQEGMLLFIAGLLLILPGFISDAIGILLLIPFTRRLFTAGLGRCLTVQAGRAGQGGASRFIFYTSSTGFGGPDPGPSRDPDGRATVIDSTAVELNSSLRAPLSDELPERDGNTNSVPEEKTTGPDASGISAAKD